MNLLRKDYDYYKEHFNVEATEDLSNHRLSIHTIGQQEHETMIREIIVWLDKEVRYEPNKETNDKT